MGGELKYLSHLIAPDTPTYGNRNQVDISFHRSDISIETYIQTTLHAGTHIDFPKHFYPDSGQSVEDFPPEFWRFRSPIYLSISPKSKIIFDEVVSKLSGLQDDYDILIVNTGSYRFRDTPAFWKENYGFAPELADFLRNNFPKIRAIGFDSISISSFTNRPLGREAHKSFLKPESPILIIEDMNLRDYEGEKNIDIFPLRVAGSDGAPCTIVAY
jgi:kynurenine formamidase